MNFSTAQAALHHDDTGIESPFSRAFEKLVDLSLKQLCDPFLAALLAYRARDILDFEKVSLYCSSG
jgi:hypothetical protein